MRLTPFPSRTKSQAYVDSGRYREEEGGGKGGSDVAGHVSAGPLIRDGDSCWDLPRFASAQRRRSTFGGSWRASHLCSFIHWGMRVNVGFFFLMHFSFVEKSPKSAPYNKITVKTSKTVENQIESAGESLLNCFKS